MTIMFSQNDNFDHFEWKRCYFLHLLSLQQNVFSSQLEISHVLNGTTPKIQYREWGPESVIFVEKSDLSQHFFFFIFKLEKDKPASMQKRIELVKEWVTKSRKRFFEDKCFSKILQLFPMLDNNQILIYEHQVLS